MLLTSYEGGHRTYGKLRGTSHWCTGVQQPNAQSPNRFPPKTSMMLYPKHCTVCHALDFFTLDQDPIGCGLIPY